MRIIFFFLFVNFVCDTYSKKFKEGEKPKWAKKDIRDYNEADLERLLDQWETEEAKGDAVPGIRITVFLNLRRLNDAPPEYVLAFFLHLTTGCKEDEEPLEPDELPEHLRPQPSIDFSKIDMSKPENLLKISKKGKTLMMFVSTTEDLSRDETETVTQLWQTGLWNNHIQAERYMIDDNRVIFMFKDGSLAWEAKDFLIDQEKCKEVTIENMNYPGKHLGIEKEKPEKEEL